MARRGMTGAAGRDREAACVFTQGRFELAYLQGFHELEEVRSV